MKRLLLQMKDIYSKSTQHTEMLLLASELVQKTVILSLAIKVGHHDPNAAQVQMVRFITIIDIY